MNIPESPSPEEWQNFEAELQLHGAREALLFDANLRQLRIDQERTLEVTSRLRKHSKRMIRACYGLSTIPTLSMVGFIKSIGDNEPLPLKLLLGTLSVGSGIFCAVEIGSAKEILNRVNVAEQEALDYGNYRLPEQ